MSSIRKLKITLDDALDPTYRTSKGQRTYIYQNMHPGMKTCQEELWRCELPIGYWWTLNSF